jgi:hypothetical protein
MAMVGSHGVAGTVGDDDRFRVQYHHEAVVIPFGRNVRQPGAVCRTELEKWAALDEACHLRVEVVQHFGGVCAVVRYGLTGLQAASTSSMSMRLVGAYHPDPSRRMKLVPQAAARAAVQQSAPRWDPCCWLLRWGASPTAALLLPRSAEPGMKRPGPQRRLRAR